MLLIDDAHWLDGESLDAVLFAVRRLDADAVVTLIAARGGEVRLESVAGLDTLELDGLDAADTAQLAESRLGRRLNAPDAARVFELTRGNPLAVIEIGTSEQALAFDGPGMLSRLVEDAYSRRLGELPPGIRSLLLVAAIDDSLDAERVERAAASTGATATLTDAEGSGLINLVDGRVVFRHPLVRSAIYQSASGAQRRRAHAAVARTLEGEAHAGRRAWHDGAASLAPDERIAAALERAADEARDRGGHGAAAVALERAARLTPDDAPRARRSYLAAASALQAGRADHARRLVEEAVTACDEPLLRADIQLLHARLLVASGAAAEGYQLLLREGRRVAALDPGRAAVMLARGSNACIRRGALSDALHVAREAGQLAEQVGDDLVDGRVGSTLAHALIFAGHTVDAESLLRRSLAAAGARHARDPLVLDRMAGDHAYLCEYPASRDLAAAAVDLARFEGALGALPVAGETLASVQFVLGAWDAAIATAADSLRLAYDTHQSQYGVWLCGVLADIAAARGRRDECLALVAEADTLAGGHAAWAGHGVARTVLGHLALATGDTKDAITQLEQEVDLDTEQASATLYMAAFDLVEAYVRANRTADAAALIQRVTPHANQAWARAALDRCRGLVAPDELFDGPSLAAAEAFARLHAPFEEARARLCRGERLRRVRRNLEARDELRAALTTFERLDAEPWAARAHRELEAAGETLGRRTRSAISELTPQELQVARIVAEGATNRDAAARLYLSTKTIEAHLHRAYRKLRITGRAQLRGALAERSDEQHDSRPG